MLNRKKTVEMMQEDPDNIRQKSRRPERAIVRLPPAIKNRLDILKIQVSNDALLETTFPELIDTMITLSVNHREEVAQIRKQLQQTGSKLCIYFWESSRFICLSMFLVSLTIGGVAVDMACQFQGRYSGDSDGTRDGGYK
jgi:hypothetical protein